MKYYAIINEENICTGYASAPSEIKADDYIEILSLPAPMGKKWENGKWVEVELPEPVEPEPTQLDRIEAAVAKSNEEIANAAIDEYTAMLMEEGVL